MRHPLHSEADAYRFLLIAVAVAAGIVAVTVLGGAWWGLAAALVLVGGVFFLYMRRTDDAPQVQTDAPRRGGADEHRILVVANETVSGAPLRAEIRLREEKGRSTQVLVVAPALNSKVRHWVSDEDKARARAQERLDVSLARLAEDGIEARGEIGDGDPLQAIEDAVRTFGPDEIIISTHPEGRSHWLERGVVSGARDRFTVPITHVVVDLSAETAEAEPQPHA
jgi:hypothetical protein